MLETIMEKLFGKSWRTAFWGLICGLISFVAFYPDMLKPLPDYWEGVIRQFVAFSMGAGLFKLGLSSRDNKVSEASSAELKKEIETVKKYEKF